MKAELEIKRVAKVYSSDHALWRLYGGRLEAQGAARHWEGAERAEE